MTKSDEDGTATTAIRAASTLESVVVHSSGAVCTRRVRFDLPPGEPGPLWVEGLPPTLFEHSLRARITSGPAGLHVTDIRLDIAAAVQRGDELPSLRLDLEDAEDRQTTLRDRCARLEAEIEEVAGFRAVPPQPRRGDPPRWAPVESILALAGFVDARLALLHKRLRAAEEELRGADHDADVLGRRLESASSAVPAERTRQFFTAVLALTRLREDGPALDGPERDSAEEERTGGPEGAGAPTAVELELEYQVPGATWSPVYQLRLERGAGTGSLVLRASVAQRTGEDWKGVRLALSTADLLRRTGLPELRSLRIGRSQPEPLTRGWREPPPGLDELFAGYDAALRPRFPEPQPVPAPLPASVPRPRHPSFPDPPAPGGAFDASAMEVHDTADDWMSDGEASRGYGGPPLPPTGAAPQGPSRGAPPAPVPPAQQQPAAVMHRRAKALTGSTPAAPPPDAMAAAPPPEPGPTEDMLDYARLALAGPEEPDGRGTLGAAPGSTDAVVVEYRRRAESVAGLARPVHAVDVRRSAGSFDYRFDTAAPVDVEADGVWHTVPVCRIAAGMVPEYVCVPSVDKAVYGTVLLTNSSAHALLAGPADVMVDGEFVLTAALPTLAPGERRRVGIGVEESVQVARHTHMRESTAGLRGGTTVLDHTVEVEVANRLPHPVVLEVRERVPVSTDKDVRVDEQQAVPPWAARDQPLLGQDTFHVRGSRVWRVELEPGRKATLTGGYTIRIPAGKAVVGGNRRD